MNYSHDEHRAQENERLRRKRREERNKAIAELRDKARRMGYKLVKGNNDNSKIHSAKQARVEEFH